MPLTNAELHLILDRASTLGERLSGDFIPIEDDGALGRQRLARWRQLSDGNDRKKFADVLRTWQREPACELDLLKLLGPVVWLSDAPLPSWVLLLRQIADATAEISPGQQFTAADKRQRARISRVVPYADAYWPIVDFAWTRATGDLAGADAWLDSGAVNGLKRHLLEKISNLASPILHPSFLARRSYAYSGLAGRFFSTRSGPGLSDSRVYDAFVNEQARTGLRTLFIRFPVLARIIAVVTQQWTECVREFLQRLEDDLEILEDHFNGGSSIGKIQSISAGISDPHHGGRSVLIASFRNGLRLVYKPRPMLVDRLFYELVAEFNHRDGGTRLRVMKIVDQGDYGWMAFARQEPCINQSAAERFYHRAGALTCLVHWLQGIDFHRENIVAAGEHPVLVDLECLAHPFRTEELTMASTEPGRSLAGSVLRTGLLPVWQRRLSTSTWFDGSGFGASIRHKSMLCSAQWQQINTDRMTMCLATQWRRHSAHRLRLNKKLLSITNFERAVIAGYERMAKELEGPGAARYSHWQEAIQQTARRYVVRPTAIYGLLLTRSLQASVLAHGVDRSIELEALPCNKENTNVRRVEISSLEQLDVPCFTVAAGDGPDPQTGRRLAQQPAKLMDEAETVRLSLRRKLKLEAGQICVWGVGSPGRGAADSTAHGITGG